MSSFIVNGGKLLSGSIRVSGSKNAALPIIFSTLAISGISKIHNAPNIGDVEVAIGLLRGFGAIIKKEGNSVIIDTKNIEYCKPSDALTSSLRGSTYLIGGMLARFGRAYIGAYGGCSFAPRPIDLHIYAMEQMGARREGDNLLLENPHGAIIEFPKPSVGATANAMILAASIDDITELYGCAVEPHIHSLADFLRSAGAEISIEDRHIKIRGCQLSCGEIALNGDMIEAATFHILSLLTGGSIVVEGVENKELSCFYSKLQMAGANIDDSNTGMRLHGKLQTTIDIIATPYPGFATDIAPLCAPLLARYFGGCIMDTVFPSRFGYLSTLASFGLKYNGTYGSATISPSTCHASIVTAPDLRGGMAAMLLALSIQGKSIIRSAEIVLRGYSELCKKLNSLGAEIQYCD